MKHVKIASLILLSALMVSALGQFSAVHSDSALREKALAYVQNVLPLDMESYAVSYGDDYALPQGPGDEVLTEAASVYLTSSETTLLAHFMFRNGPVHPVLFSVIVDRLEFDDATDLQSIRRLACQVGAEQAD